MSFTHSQSRLLAPCNSQLEAGKMYLRLYHGRHDPTEVMDDWGFVGPTVGPLTCYVHTYCSTFRIFGENPADELWLDKHDDMIQWQTGYYGDMELFIAAG